MRSSVKIGSLFLLLVVSSRCDSPAPDIGGASITGLAPRVKTVETAPLAIDRIYHSMAGPYEWVDMDLSDIGWVTAYRAEVIDAETDEKLGDEYFCHSQLQQENGTRLMVTATGADEIRFPQGFGMPVRQIIHDLPESERQLRFFGMVLNNYDTEINLMAKIRGTIEYYPLEDVGSPPRLNTLH